MKALLQMTIPQRPPEYRISEDDANFLKSIGISPDDPPPEVDEDTERPEPCEEELFANIQQLSIRKEMEQDD
jgi:hypothetical protein